MSTFDTHVVVLTLILWELRKEIVFSFWIGTAVQLHQLDW